MPISEKKFFELTNQLPWTTNPSGELRENLDIWQKFTGLPQKSITGKKWLNAIHPDDTKKVSDTLNTAFSQLTPFEITFRLKRFDGSFRNFLGRAKPIFKKNGKIKQWVGTFIDITENLSVQQTQEKELDTKKKFIAVVAHEFRSSLFSMQESVKLILDGLAGNINDEQKKILNLLDEIICRLIRLVEEILDFRKNDSKILNFTYQKNNLNEVVQHVYNAMFPVACKKKLFFNLNLCKELVNINLDKDKISQVLFNLVHNALKFTESGHISITTKKYRKFAKVVVQNSGPLVDSKKLNKILKNKSEEISKLNLDNNSQNGNGLGLKICKEIIAGHKGKIWVSSHPLRGNIFQFTLPILKLK